MKMRLIVLSLLMITVDASAQMPEKKPAIDTTFNDEDYDLLFNDLDKLLDSLTTPRSFVMFNIGIGNSYFNYETKSGFALQSSNQVTYAPSFSYFSKTGLGISATSIVMNDGMKWNPYQLNATLSYDYIRNHKFITGIALTRFFTKDSLPFYTSPLKNQLYAYFTYKNFWLKSSVAGSYGWGSRRSYQEQQDYITTLRLQAYGYTRINTRESINDFNLITSVRHDFYWMNIFAKHDYIRFTPQIVFTSGTQKFGFNQTSSSYATLPRTGTNVLYNTNNVILDNQTYFQPLALSTYIKTQYSKGIFFIQPQLILDYYFPANEKNFSTAFVMNAGVIF